MDLFTFHEACDLVEPVFYRLRCAMHPGSSVELPAGTVFQVSKEEEGTTGGYWIVGIPRDEALRLSPPHYFGRSSWASFMDPTPLPVDNSEFLG